MIAILYLILTILASQVFSFLERWMNATRVEPVVVRRSE